MAEFAYDLNVYAAHYPLDVIGGRIVGTYVIAEIHRLRDLALLLGCKTAIERVASFFVDLIGDDAESPSEILLPVSRAEMALYLGLTIETVCRNVTLLKQSGLITAEGRDAFTIVNRTALRRIAQGKTPSAK